MFFLTIEFFAFFFLVLLLNWLLKKWPLVWRLFLLLVSYYFYWLWDFRFLGILVVVSIFNYILGLLIERNFWHSRRFILICGVIANVAVLGFFKYYDFFRVSMETFLPKLGFSTNLPFLEIILPVGISFYIFRNISYLADVAWGKIKAEKSVIDYSLFVAFFPQLLAGPITRAGDFLSQLKNGGNRVITDFYDNITLIILGLFKKLVLSSFLVLNLTDDVFAVPQNHSAEAIFLAILAYTLVIYFDFSGYSDMAIGYSGLLGFKLPANFNTPYLATSLKDFWKRWHISLSSWIKDYIYIPLGGNRKGAFRKNFNLIFAMTISGLWHGSAGHYIFWGFWHGVGSAFEHLFSDKSKMPMTQLNNAKTSSQIKEKLKKVFGWLATFIFVAVGWVFFRAPSFQGALAMLGGLFKPSNVVEAIPLLVILVTVGGLLFLFLEKPASTGFNRLQARLPFALWLVIIVIIFISLFNLSPQTVPPFIYFSF
ncbi:MAG: MBOAT family protein [Candidatus Gribaldobacteria bacterium]|nr:MBOAT family protein [Candidatus Gribaldobacteria bacterium]